MTGVVEHYTIVSLPYFQRNDQQLSSQFTYLQQMLGELGTAMRLFSLPTLKIGTLDSLMEASDTLARLDPQLEGTLYKTASILQEATGKPRSAVTVLRTKPMQEFTCDSYLKHFEWNSAQFDTKEPIRILNDKLSSVATNAEERIRSVVSEFSEARSKLVNAQRKGQGSLSARSINSTVAHWEQIGRGKRLDTEFLTTVFVAVPVPQNKEFMAGYWHLHEFVVPGSAQIVQEDPEFTLYAVVVFKRAHEDFKMGCRKNKYVVRELDPDDVGEEDLARLNMQVEQQRNSLVSLLSQQFALCYVAWIHVKGLRIFVESMLKYGLPPKFIPVLLAVDHAKEAAIRKKLSQIVDLKNPLMDDANSHEVGALQYEYPYVSLKVSNIAL